MDGDSHKRWARDIWNTKLSIDNKVVYSVRGAYLKVLSLKAKDHDHADMVRWTYIFENFIVACMPDAPERSDESQPPKVANLLALTHMLCL